MGRKAQLDIKKIFGNPKFRGKHIVAVEGQVFTARTGKEAVRLFNKTVKKYPGKTPTVTYVPKAESLVLVSWK